MGNLDLIIILTTAFLGSVGHCIGMCGGIVIAYSSSKIDQQTSYWQQTFSHLAYNFGRVTTYTILGALFGFAGKVLAFTPTTKRGAFCTHRYTYDTRRSFTYWQSKVFKFSTVVYLKIQLVSEQL